MLAALTPIASTYTNRMASYRTAVSAGIAANPENEFPSGLKMAGIDQLRYFSVVCKV
jgi:hypothetical protein